MQGAFKLSAAIQAWGTAVGKKEYEGPLGHLFDLHDPDCKFGQKTWESAESEMQRMALAVAMARMGVSDGQIGALFAGDLQNQCVGSAYGLLSYDIPYLGLYGACSTCAEGLLLSAVTVTSRACSLCAAVTSSHFCAAERQYRSPLEYGSQRPPTAQWTVTGAGAFLVGRPLRTADEVLIVHGMAGKAKDYGINDANNMGAAMAPAARDTLLRFFADTHTAPEDYDRIVTGDLGFEGGDILCQLLLADGLDISSRYEDCGRLIYHKERQDVHSGGSGCGCAASVLAAEILPKISKGEWKRILFMATGAMMSPDSIKQGGNIPAVAHLLELRTALEQREEFL
ncbi:MAG: stage V sporulation protein AD [Ruminococcaceae bacterium]|nr:stage V sporulation protein AD [Oscillospiraceae bacterium]